VARALAPSVVLLEDVDQVFVSDKTRAAALAPPGGEPPNRIKKQLLAEVRQRHAQAVAVVLGGGTWVGHSWPFQCPLQLMSGALAFVCPLASFGCPAAGG
jgi:hypothetical protein